MNENATPLYMLDPGSSEARGEGCVCDPQVPRVVGKFCPTCQWTTDSPEPLTWCPHDGEVLSARRAFRVEVHCPVHGLAEAKALVDGQA